MLNMFWLKNIVIFSIIFQKLCRSQEWQHLTPSYYLQGYDNLGYNHKFQNNKEFVLIPTQSSLYKANLQYQRPNIYPQLILVPQVTLKPKENIDFRKPKTQTFYKATLSETQSPVYEFRYKIHDSKENNYQEKYETRIGDAVKGYYSVREPNGYLRLVKYVSDKSGFHTQVSHHHTDHNEGSSYLSPLSQHLT